MKKVSRNDAWQSIVQASLGPSGVSDPSSWNFVRTRLLTPEQLSALYDGNWLARRVVDLKPASALKDGWLASEDALQQYQLLGYTPEIPEGVVLRAATQGRQYGGALLVVAHTVGAGDLSQPLTERPGPVLWLDVVPRPWLKIKSRAGLPSDARPNAPDVFEITAGPRKGLLVHASRTIVFGGDAPSAQASLESHEGFWTQSILQAGYDDILRIGARNVSLDRLLARSSTQALRIKDLLASVASTEGSVLNLRLEALRLGIERTNLILLDGNDESYEVHNVSLSGFDGPLEQALQQVAAAFDYPATVLLKQSPAGMNATGESDLAIYHQAVASYQRNYLQQRVNTLSSWLSQSEESVSWPPIRERSNGEKATDLAATLDAYERLDDWGVTDTSKITELLQLNGLIDPRLVLVTPEAEETQLKVQLAPTDVAKILRVNEARAAQGLPPLGDARGQLTIDELTRATEAEYAAQTQKAAET